MQTTLRGRVVLFFFLLSATLGGHAAAAEAPLRIGVAETDITPPVGFPMAGYYHERRATGALDPLKAKALVLRQGDVKAALVVCDLCGIATDLSREVRKRAAARTMIPEAHIAVSATHSHTSPDYTKDLFEHLRKKGPKAADSPTPYAEKLIAGIVEAIVTAHGRAAPVSLSVGSARQETPVSFNRRFVMKDGSVRTWMRLDNPEVVRAAGPIDPEVGVLVARAVEKGPPTALLTNFALHLDTVGGNLWSADYPYHLEQALRGTHGKELISIFGNGCCGDINHVDPVAKERNKADFIGRALAVTVERAVTSARPVAKPNLRVRHATIPLPLQKVAPRDVARVLPILLDARAGKRVDFEEAVRGYKAVMLDQLWNKPATVKTSDYLTWGLSHAFAGIGSTLPVDMHVFCLGDDVAIVCFPGEPFVDLGLAIKRASPFRTTIIVELSNNVEMIYIPTRAAYAGGSYEVTNSCLEPGAGEMLVETALRLLRDAAMSRQPR